MEDLEKTDVLEDQEQIRRDMDIRNEAVKEKNMAWIELSQTKVSAALMVLMIRYILMR